MLSWLFAAAHLLALGIGLGSVWARARALRGPLDAAGLRNVFYADGWWGGAAFLWLSTGLVRLFGGFEKGTPYYVHNHFFWGKMLLFLTIFALEIAPMMALVRWRAQVKRGETPDTSRAAGFARVSTIQAWLLVLMVLLAAGMARGMGMPHE